MPTIELLSVEAESWPIQVDDYEMAIKSDGKLESHRALFYDWCMAQQGVLIHLGNPKDQYQWGLSGGKLIDFDFKPHSIQLPLIEEGQPILDKGANHSYQFKFLPKYLTELVQLWKAALKHSPISKACFWTDYQFG
ncbi:MAG: hypothetical protein AAF598_21440, partial [Bacteroidota bacterium]